jgi:quercetin dioxygenase-like cupin family protein
MKETNVTQAIIRKADEGRTVAVVGDVYRFLATGEDTHGKYALWEAIVPPGGGPPPHVHSREEEGFYVLEGEIAFTINGKKQVATAGMFANMPVGTPHSFKNESDKPAKMLISVAPAGLERCSSRSACQCRKGRRRPHRRPRKKSRSCWRLHRGTGSRSGCQGIDATKAA